MEESCCHGVQKGWKYNSLPEPLNNARKKKTDFVKFHYKKVKKTKLMQSKSGLSYTFIYGA